MEALGGRYIHLPISPIGAVSSLFRFAKKLLRVADPATARKLLKARTKSG